MTRVMPFVLGALACALVCVPVAAEEPLKKLTAEERKGLEAKWKELTDASFGWYQARKYPEAIKQFEQALEVARRLYNKAEFPDGHADLAATLNDLAFLYQTQGKLAEAESLLKDALAMRKRLFKDDHPDLARSLNDLAGVYHAQGKYADAESPLKDSLDMKRRLIKGDHPALVNGLNNLAILYRTRGELADAEPVLKDALEMCKRLFKGDHECTALILTGLAKLYRDQGKLGDAEPYAKEALAMHQRLFKGDHPALADSLSNLAAVYHAQEKLAEAEPLVRDALAMRRRLFGEAHRDVASSLCDLASVYHGRGKPAEAESHYKDALEIRKKVFRGDHPDLSFVLSNLGTLYVELGKVADAEPLLKEALEMDKRLFGGDHRDIATGLSNLAGLYQVQGRFADAAPLLKEALAMYRRLTLAAVRDKSEGEALTLLARQPLSRDGFLSCTLACRSDPADVYGLMWVEKGYIARAYERRQLQARSAVAGAAARVLAELTDARRRRAELLLAPATNDPVTRDRRDKDIRTYADLIEARTGELKKLLPASARADRLAGAPATALRDALPADAAVVDFVHYTCFEQDPNKPGTPGKRWIDRYSAFVLTKRTLARVELGAAAEIEVAITAWRNAITGGKEIPAAVPAKVRALVWETVRTQLPANIKTVYICPDATLCRVPWGALSGDEPGTILLEDFALATIPHAPFLLDKLWPRDPSENPPTGALVVGAVKYDAELAPAAPAAPSPGPLVKPGAKLGWSFLANTIGEANGVGATAERKKITATRIEGEKATTSAVLSALPKARYAHLATHGFFADPSFRGLFQLDEKDYARRGGERIGRAVNSPLLMTGLVFAGANNPKTPGRGILTGEQLVDLDLRGLELACCRHVKRVWATWPAGKGRSAFSAPSTMPGRGTWCVHSGRCRTRAPRP